MALHINYKCIVDYLSSISLYFGIEAALRIREGLVVASCKITLKDVNFHTERNQRTLSDSISMNGRPRH